MSRLLTTDEALTHVQELEITCVEQDPQRASPPEPSFIPNEIWAEIFVWYAVLCCTFRATAPSASAWMLGHVCREWRDLALSMPQLWKHPPVIYITPESLKGGHFREGWDEFLLRSGTLPLKLHLSFELPLGGVLGRSCEALTPFFDHVERWEHLTISGLRVMQAQDQFKKVSSRLSLLRSVTFNFAATTSSFASSPSFDVFEFAPKLTHINLHSPSPAFKKSRLRFPWAQLTDYKETGIDMGTFPVLLDYSQQLETLQYRGRNFRYYSTEWIVQPSLRHLIIEAKEIAGFWGQLADVTFPALETFSVRALQRTPGRPPHISTLTNLVVRSGCFLKKLVLDLRSGPFANAAMNDLFSRIGDLEGLELGDCHGPNFYAETMSSLIFRQDKTTLLPRLRFLTLHNGKGFDWSDGSIISDVARSREKAIVDDTSPGQLLAALEHLRIITPSIYDRHNVLCKILSANASATRSSFIEPPTTRLSLVHYINTFLEQLQKDCQHRSFQEATPELISVLTLTYFIEDTHVWKDTLNDLEKLGILSVARSHLLRHRWIPGCKEDILYVHPNHQDAAAVPELWEAIDTANVNTLESLLGYQLVNKQEDDLKDVDDIL